MEVKLTPIKPEEVQLRPRSWIRGALDAFLESKSPVSQVELETEQRVDTAYIGVANFLRNHKEYRDKVRVMQRAGRLLLVLK